MEIMSKAYRQTIEEDKRERAMERELGIPPRVPVQHRFVVITEEDGQTRFIEAKPVGNFLAGVFEAMALLFLIGFGLLLYAAFA